MINQTKFQIVRKKDILKQLGISNTAFYELIKIGEFPPGIKLGARAVGWLQTDIDHFITVRLQASRSSTQTSGERHAS